MPPQFYSWTSASRIEQESTKSVAELRLQPKTTHQATASILETEHRTLSYGQNQPSRLIREILFKNFNFLNALVAQWQSAFLPSRLLWVQLPSSAPIKPAAPLHHESVIRWVFFNAVVAQLVEYHLAMVNVGSSTLLNRSSLVE